ncbi:MAG: type II/IV secretion system protein [Armatimonadetes bacterium]|nr:type II/IV secretion system protein [Armatimonadota bacterium]
MTLLHGAFRFIPQDEEQKLAWDLVQRIILDAASERSSDIHMEPCRGDCIIRYRIDGVLREISRHSSSVLQSVSKVLKKLGNMDPDVDQFPQDGKILCEIGLMRGENRVFDFRLSTFPTVSGEKVVMRILDPALVSSAIGGGFEAIGLRGDSAKKMQEILEKPFGLVIFSGPTGCGKTTTVYSSLTHIVGKTGGACNVMSLECPVEYVLDGVTQTLVKPAEEFGYAQAMRAAMRQDPDIISCAEISDLETAQAVVQAALTGHLVLAVLHAPDAPSAALRLSEIGIEPYLVPMALEGIVSQRLLRKICLNCARPSELDPVAKEAFEETAAPVPIYYKGAGCEQCRGSGYRGRTGVYEILPRDNHILGLIAQSASPEEIRQEMLRLGCPTLRQAALQLAAEGVTTVEEALRATAGV